MRRNLRVLFFLVILFFLLRIFSISEQPSDKYLDYIDIGFQKIVIDSIEYVKDGSVNELHQVDLTDIKTVNSRSFTFSNIVADGIFWSSEVEAIVPSGPTGQETFTKMNELRAKKVRSLDSAFCNGALQAPWKKTNRFVYFDDGSNACARYRELTEAIQGDIMAFYMARLLGISNSPITILSEVKVKSLDRQI